MSKRSFTLLVIPDTPYLKAIQLDMSYLMFWLIVIVFLGSFGGIGYLLYDFHNSDQSDNIIARNLQRRQQMSMLNQELAVLERRMLHLITSSTEEPIPIPESNENLMTYQMRITLTQEGDWKRHLSTSTITSVTQHLLTFLLVWNSWLSLLR